MTINSIGLRRRGLSEDSIGQLKRRYRILSRSQLNTGAALMKVRQCEWTAPEVLTLLEFIETSERGLHSLASSKTTHDSGYPKNSG